MQSGLIAEVNGDFDSIPDDNFPIEREDGLKATLYNRSHIQNQTGDTIVSGVVAEEKRISEETVEITERGTLNEDLTINRKVTSFLTRYQLFNY